MRREKSHASSSGLIQPTGLGDVIRVNELDPVSVLSNQHCSNSAILSSMKTAITITSRGIITLPAKLRQALGVKANDQLIAETTPEGLLLRPAVTLPVEMYSPAREREFDAAEAELASLLASKIPKQSVTARRSRKTVR
jgi:antitoxin PrlF